MIALAAESNNLLRVSTSMSGSFGEIIASFMPYFIVLIFMSFAAVQVLKTSAAGGSAITGVVKKIGRQIKKRGKRLGLATQRWARNRGEKMAERKGFLGRNLRYFTGREGIDDKEKTRFNTGIRKWFRKAPIIGLGPSGLATPGRWVAAQLTEYEIKDFNERKDKIAKYGVERQGVELSEAMTKTQRGAAIAAIQESGNTNDVPNMPKGDELQKILESLLQSNSAALAKSLRFLDPAVTAKAVEKLGDKLTKAQRERAGVGFDEDKDGKDIEEYGTREGKLLAKMKVQKMEYMDEDAAQRYVQKGGLGHVFWTGAHMAKGAELLGRKFTESFSKGMESESWYDKHNPRLGKWIGGTAARNLGIGYDAKIPVLPPNAKPPVPPPLPPEPPNNSQATNEEEKKKQDAKEKKEREKREKKERKEKEKEKNPFDRNEDATF